MLDMNAAYPHIWYVHTHRCCIQNHLLRYMANHESGQFGIRLLLPMYMNQHDDGVGKMAQHRYLHAIRHHTSAMRVGEHVVFQIRKGKGSSLKDAP